MTKDVTGPEHRENRTLAGIFYIIGAALMFAILGALVRRVSSEIPNEMVVFFRSLFALVFFMPWFMRRYPLSQLRTQVFHLHLLRSLTGLGAMYCYFYTLAHMKLAEAVLLSYTSPLFVPVIAFFWLREPIYRYIRVAILVGFVGIIFVLKPGMGVFQEVSLFGILAAVLASVAVVTIRRMSVSEPPARTVFYFTCIAAVVSLIPMLFAWQTPKIETWVLLLMIGAVAITGQILMTKGYSMAPATHLIPFIYSTVVFAAIIGWLVFGEVVDIWTLIGALLVCASGVIASGRQR